MFTRDVRRLRPLVNDFRFRSAGLGGDPMIEIELSNDADPYTGQYREMATIRLWTPGYAGCGIQAVAPDGISTIVCDW